MISGYRPARRRRGRSNRAVRIAVPVTTVAALGLTVGIFVAASGGGPAKLHPAAASSATQGVSSSAVNDTCDIIVPATR